MNVIKSFSYDAEKEQQIIEEFEKIAQREKKKFSGLAIEAMKEYVEKHKDGNNQMRLDSPCLRAIPQLESSFEKWNKFLEGCNSQELQDLHDYSGHVFYKTEQLLKR